MKKIISFILSLIIVLGLAITINAEEDNNVIEQKSIQISDIDYYAVEENENYRLYLNEENGYFAIINIKSNKIWNSVPSNLYDVKMKNSRKNQVCSNLILQIFDVETKTLSITANSKNDGELKVTKLTNGVCLSYDFAEYGITVPLCIELKPEGFSAYIKTDDVKETNDRYQLVTIELLPYFNSGYKDENGFLLVPDGSGALINFNNGKGDLSTYSQQVYGKDFGLSSLYETSTTQNVPIGYFGVSHNDSYSISLISDGAAEATVEARSNNSNNLYNCAYAKFAIRKCDYYRNSGEWLDVPIYKKQFINGIEFRVDYILVYSSSDYSTMAVKLRNYLVENDFIKNSNTENVLQIDFLGSTIKKKSFFGIPMNRVQILTDFKEAEQIIIKLSENGIKNPLIRYLKWNKSTVWGESAASANLSLLGGKKDFNAFKSSVNKIGGSLYLDANPIWLYKSKGLFSYFTDYAHSVFNEPLKQFGYKINTTAQDISMRKAYLIKKDLITTQASKWNNVIKKLSADGFSFSGCEVVYSDFRNQGASATLTTNEFKKALNKFEKGVAVNNGNLYSLGNAAFISDAPCTSSNFVIEDVSVPFYQMLLHGIIEYSLSPINIDSNYQKLYLRSVETGAMLSFKLTAAKSGEINDSQDAALVAGNIDVWRDILCEMYLEYSTLYKEVCNSQIIGHSKVDEDIYKTVYSNGISVIVNYSDVDYIITDGETVKANSFIYLKEVEGN